MAITTLDGLLAAMPASPQPFVKTGITMAAAGAARAYTPWYASVGFPGASTANAAGINGQAVDDSLGATVGGRLPRTNPAGGLQSRVARLGVTASQAGTLWLIDRLWQNSGLSLTITTAQSITPAALPARDRDGTTNGVNVLAAIEWSGTGGAGTPNFTASYTNSDGTAGRSTVFQSVATPPVGTVELFGLQAGDRGIRSVQSITLSATHTSGTAHLVLFRVLAQVEVSVANIGFAADQMAGFARVYDSSALQLLWFPSATTALTMSGQYTEAQG